MILASELDVLHVTQDMAGSHRPGSPLAFAISNLSAHWYIYIQILHR